MKALLTGFTSRGRGVSPSVKIVDELRGRKVGGADVVGAELPEDFSRIPGLVKSILASESPDIAVSLGWDNPPWVKVEKIAINVMSAYVGDRVIPDEEGYKPVGLPVVPGGPLAYLSTFPADNIARVIRKGGVRAFASHDAGTHIRNATLYSLLHWTSRSRARCLVGQLHLPPLPGMFGEDQPTMDLDTETRAVETAIIVCAKTLLHGPRK